NDSDDARLSSNGRYIVFSSATALVDGVASRQVYRKSMDNESVVLVSATDSALKGGNAESSGPKISSDGRYVLFLSDATDLVPGTRGQVLRKDLQTGKMVLVSASASSALKQADGVIKGYQ